MNMTDLTARAIERDSSVAEFAESLYNEAFDRRMRIPYRDLFKVADKHKADFTAVYSEDLFVGFYYAYHYNDVEFIYYLAVVENMRCRGFGTEILDLIKDTYACKTIVLCTEAPNVDDKLVSSRYRRLAFYSRNGFIDTLYKFTSLGIMYEVLYWGSNFQPEDIQSILRSFRRNCGMPR